VHIFAHSQLQLLDVIVVFKVCRRFHNLEAHPEIWKALTRRITRNYRTVRDAGVLDELNLSWKGRFLLHDHGSTYGFSDKEFHYEINELFEFFVDALAVVDRRCGCYTRLSLGKFVVGATDNRLSFCDDGQTLKPCWTNAQLIANINDTRLHGRCRAHWKEYIIYARRRADGAVAKLFDIGLCSPRPALNLRQGSSHKPHDEESASEPDMYTEALAYGISTDPAPLHLGVNIAWEHLMERRGVAGQNDVGAEVIFAMPRTADSRDAVDRISFVHIEFGYVSNEASHTRGRLHAPFQTEALFYGLRSGDLQWMR